MSYASFWKRTAAYVVDYFISYFISLLIGFIVGFVMARMGVNNVAIQLVGILLGIIVFVVYFVWAESSSWQATIGKKIFGLKVTNLNGERISFWRSLGRHLGCIVSGMILCIGYLMCLWTEKKQCLHDMMAGCLVIDNTPNEKQGCAIAVIVAWILFLLFSIGSLILLVMAIAAPQYPKAVERVRLAQARAALSNVSIAREIYMLQTNSPATRWDQLEKGTIPDCTIQSDPRVCVERDFTYVLAPNVITATRNSETDRYVLSIDSNGKWSCNAESENARAICEQVIQ